MKDPPDSPCRIQQELDDLRMALVGEREVLQQHTSLLVQHNLTLAECTREQLDLWVAVKQTGHIVCCELGLSLGLLFYSSLPEFCCAVPVQIIWRVKLNAQIYKEEPYWFLFLLLRLAQELQEKNCIIQNLESQLRDQSSHSHHSSHSDLCHSDRTSSSYSSPTTHGSSGTQSKHKML